MKKHVENPSIQENDLSSWWLFHIELLVYTRVFWVFVQPKKGVNGFEPHSNCGTSRKLAAIHVQPTHKNDQKWSLGKYWNRYYFQRSLATLRRLSLSRTVSNNYPFIFYLYQQQKATSTGIFHHHHHQKRHHNYIWHHGHLCSPHW